MNITPGRFWLAAAALSTGAAAHVTDPFVGKWHLDASRSVLTDEMSIAIAGPNTYTLKFIGVDPETIVADGQDHPGSVGQTVAITIEQPGLWKISRKRGGREVVAAIWTLGADDRLHDSLSLKLPDGSVSTTTFAYKRTAGDSGIPGAWESTSGTMDPFDLEIESTADGLSITDSRTHSTSQMRFVSEDHRAAGSSAFVLSARRIDQRAYEVTTTVQGKVTSTQRATVSEDGKTLTMSTQLVDQKRPRVLVFDRE